MNPVDRLTAATARWKAAGPLPVTLLEVRYLRAFWKGRGPKARVVMRFGRGGLWALRGLPKRVVRQLAGLVRPVKCPTCRMPTRQRLMRVDGPETRFCLSCESSFTSDTLLVRRRDGVVISRRSVAPRGTWTEILLRTAPGGVRRR